MKVLRLSFQNYRNLKPGMLEACETVNVIYGQNGQGKTNLLEAMWLFTGGHSFRGARDGELICLGGENARLELEFFSEEREQQAVVAIMGGRRSAELNGVAKRSASELIGKFCGVIFSPEHLSLVKDGPAMRRAFLDAALCQIKPAYASLLSRYNRTLSQRNMLLKDIPRHRELMDTLPVWDERLAGYGSRIIQQRTAYLNVLSAPAGSVYGGISREKEVLGLSYSRKPEQSLLEALQNTVDTDIYAGHTTEGPHRDDLEITLNRVSARAYASQGQQRSIVLALKLAEAQVLQERSGEPPVIFLDDVMSELDASRQDYLLNSLTGRQVFITCCEPETAGRLKEGCKFRVEAGQISQGTE